MIPMMKKEGYHADYAVNVTTHAALVGALMPTSHNMIIYSLAAGGKVSITALILAGMLPAALLMACMLIAAYLVAIKRGYPAGTFPGWNAVLATMASAVPGLFVVAIILVGILSGVFTATESAAIAVVYEVADLTGKSLASLSTNPWVIFLLVNVILFVLGTFLDMAATILICTPIFLPICMQYGMDPVQFGMLMLINCALGLNTPPVGTTQFVGCAIGGISVGQVMRTILPFYGALIAALLLVTYVPAFSLALPNLFLGK